MVNNNYEVAWRHYSYSVLRNQLRTAINDLFNEHDHQQAFDKLSDQGRVIYLKNDPSPDQYDQLEEEIAGNLPN